MALLILVAIVVVWGIWEYREREIRHKMNLHGLQQTGGILPNKRQGWGKAAMSVFVLAVLILLIEPWISLVIHTGLYRYWLAVAVISAEYLALTVVILLMSIRDFNLARREKV